MRYLLGIDFGTGGTKVCLTDEELNMLAYSFREYPIYTDYPDWSEHSPERYYSATCENIRACLAKSGVSPRDIAAIAVSAAMPSLVVTDQAGEAIGCAINLMDRRAKEEVAYVAQTIGIERYFSVTANRLEDHPSIVNLLWLKRHMPDVYSRIRAVHSIDGYLTYRFTGVHNVNSSNAMFFGAYDIYNRRFDEQMLTELGLDPAMFPPVTGCEEVIGTLTPQAAEDTGLIPGIPVLSGQTDCNAGWLGGGAIAPGDIQMNLGTCGNFGIITSEPDFLPTMINFEYTVPGTYIVVPTTLTGGVLIRYIRDQFSHLELATQSLTGLDAYDLLNHEAERISPGSEGLVVLPYLMGERTPIWDADAKGTIFGLSLRHTKGHIVRAMMESVAYALFHSFETLSPHIRHINTPLVLNEGGAKSVLWRRIITDVFNLPTVLVKNRAGAPYGDCLLAAKGAGLIKDYAIARERAEYIDPMEPDPRTHEQYMEYFALYKQLYAQLKDQFKTLSALTRKYG
ncbi:MAG: FGGY-family carbohydrate kinase [Christensenellales bacterium]|jgi:sugar (pentulose or hexulose) kinase